MLRPARRLAALLVLGATPALAQAPLGGGDGFLFRAPIGALSLRVGYDVATANGDPFRFATERLTLSRSSFSGVAAAGEVTLRVAPRADVALGGAIAGASRPSEFRRFVGSDDLPIAQRTSFLRVPLTAGVRVYPRARGRSIGRFAYVPASFAPYLAAGGGTVWYRFRQSGEFVNEQTLAVFPATLQSSSWTPMAYGAAGAEWSLTPRIGLSSELRYTAARATLGGDFENFDRIDLSGLAATVGVALRF